jgi:hypothetical protein
MAAGRSEYNYLSGAELPEQNHTELGPAAQNEPVQTRSVQSRQTYKPLGAPDPRLAQPGPNNPRLGPAARNESVQMRQNTTRRGSLPAGHSEFTKRDRVARRPGSEATSTTQLHGSPDGVYKYSREAVESLLRQYGSNIKLKEMESRPKKSSRMAQARKILADLNASSGGGAAQSRAAPRAAPPAAPRATDTNGNANDQGDPTVHSSESSHEAAEPRRLPGARPGAGAEALPRAPRPPSVQRHPIPYGGNNGTVVPDSESDSDSGDSSGGAGAEEDEVAIVALDHGGEDNPVFRVRTPSQRAAISVRTDRTASIPGGEDDPRYYVRLDSESDSDEEGKTSQGPPNSHRSQGTVTTANSGQAPGIGDGLYNLFQSSGSQTPGMRDGLLL